MKLLHVVGARPNFPKLAPVYHAGRTAGLEQVVVHTGQHYDALLSTGFFDDLEIPPPDCNLEVGSASHAVQTARIMERFEPVLIESGPDWLVVYGDVNSTMATALVAAKLGIRVAHVEAGLRSGDRAMPEEINRLVADRLADLLLTPSRDADEALRREGESANKIVFVGNVMIDSMMRAMPRAVASGAARRLGADGSHVVVTLHRPSNVDDEGRLRSIARALGEIGRDRTVLFPSHPRTRERLVAFGLPMNGVQMIDPLPYFDMLDVMRGAHAVVTDSGGLQEETTVLGVPCFTVRDNTERPITITEGTNRLVLDPGTLPTLVAGAQCSPDLRRPEGWDGKAGERIIAALLAR
ncbi:MAG: UDP-N-acetylglucosamine 2-epimerase [Gemmatimonadetes bacterium]|nr:UDP-N-acetylglucosamine 2-epimerase [Gemmatimonadota bacterium]